MVFARPLEMSIITSPYLIYSAWAVVVIAALAPAILSRVQSDERWVEILRSRVEQRTPNPPSVEKEIRRNARVAAWLGLFGAFAFAFRPENKGWEAVVILVGPLIAWAFVVPLAAAHTYLLRFFHFRGPVTIALAIVLCSLSARFFGPESKTPLVVFGLIYGSFIAVLDILPRPIPTSSPARDSEPQPFW